MWVTLVICCPLYYKGVNSGKYFINYTFNHRKHLVAFVYNENNSHFVCKWLCCGWSWVPKLDVKLSLFQHCFPLSFPGKFGRDPGDPEHHRDQSTSAHRSGGLSQPAHGEQGGEDCGVAPCLMETDLL